MQSLMRWFIRLVFLGACALAVSGALTPAADHPLHIFPWDKADHFLAFYVLAVLGVLAFPRLSPVVLGLGLSLLGGLIEVIQAAPFIGRDSDVKDWLADSLAVLAALGPLALARWRARARAEPAEEAARPLQ